MNRWVFCSRCHAYHDEENPKDTCPHAATEERLAWALLLAFALGLLAFFLWLAVLLSKTP